MDQETRTEVMVPTECRREAEEVTRFMMEELDQNGKEKFLEFIRGAKFALGLRKQAV